MVSVAVVGLGSAKTGVEKKEKSVEKAKNRLNRAKKRRLFREFFADFFIFRKHTP